MSIGKGIAIAGVWISYAAILCTVIITTAEKSDGGAATVTGAIGLIVVMVVTLGIFGEK